MEFNFYPWKLDIDVEKTKALYAEKPLRSMKRPTGS